MTESGIGWTEIVAVVSQPFWLLMVVVDQVARLLALVADLR